MNTLCPFTCRVISGEGIIYSSGAELMVRLNLEIRTTCFSSTLSIYTYINKTCLLYCKLWVFPVCAGIILSWEKMTRLQSNWFNCWLTSREVFKITLFGCVVSTPLSRSPSTTAFLTGWTSEKLWSFSCLLSGSCSALSTMLERAIAIPTAGFKPTCPMLCAKSGAELLKHWLLMLICLIMGMDETNVSSKTGAVKCGKLTVHLEVFMERFLLEPFVDWQVTFLSLLFNFHLLLCKDWKENSKSPDHAETVSPYCKRLQKAGLMIPELDLDDCGRSLPTQNTLSQ